MVDAEASFVETIIGGGGGGRVYRFGVIDAAKNCTAGSTDDVVVVGVALVAAVTVSFASVFPGWWADSTCLCSGW